MSKQTTSILAWTVNKAPKDIYQLKFRLEKLTVRSLPESSLNQFSRTESA